LENIFLTEYQPLIKMTSTGNSHLSFDYVIVGAGTAGCVVANRLSADPANHVCLIEAGPADKHPFIHVPAATGAAIGTRALNWRFKTAPQRHLNNREIPQPRGRGLGGSSSINGMVYSRGHPLDYDDWAAAGASGWSYAEVLPYFIRSENNQSFRDSPWHGTNGEMAVSHIRDPNPLNAVFERAMAAQGFKYNGDMTGNDPEGYGPRQMNIRNGRRESMATAFLRPIRGRSNLSIITHALALRVIIENGKAAGVEIERNGNKETIMVRREVILCAGAVQSPQLLMLSGIGAGAHLQDLGIPVIHDLPGVGANLHDHPSAPVMMETRVADSYGISLRALPRDIWNVFQYLLFRRGALASNLFESAAFLRTTGGLDRPDMQFVFQPARKMLTGFPIPIGHGHVLNPVCLYPRSRGRLSLADADPHTPPVIDTNLLADPEDVKPIIRGIEIARRVFADPAFARYAAVETGPGPGIQGEAALTEYVKGICYPINHQVGTCRMGSDPESVLDPQLRVRGIADLRVADAAVFPVIVGGNTNAAVVMVAEKAADMILGKPPLPAANLNAPAS
jgi:choline dehydrogenase-like flavoprotein